MESAGDRCAARDLFDALQRHRAANFTPSPGWQEKADNSLWDCTVVGTRGRERMRRCPRPRRLQTRSPYTSSPFVCATGHTHGVDEEDGKRRPNRPWGG